MLHYQCAGRQPPAYLYRQQRNINQMHKNHKERIHIRQSERIIFGNKQHNTL
jgi:hypothetical protein